MPAVRTTHWHSGLHAIATILQTSNVILWRGEPASASEALAAPVAQPSMIATLLKMAEDHIATLKEQLDVKDRQLAESQETMREQMRLLTYAGPALSKTTDEVEELNSIHASLGALKTF